VVVSDFLPYIQSLHANLFKPAAIESVAKTTPYALKHMREQSSQTTKPELDISSIAEPLNSIVKENSN